MSPYLENPPPARPRLVAHLLARLAPVAGEEDIAAVIAPLSDSALAAALHLDERATLHSLKAASRRARPVGEAKVVTHDGPIWPVPRAQMSDEAEIVQRMAEDIAALARDSQDMHVELWRLLKLGWPASVVDLLRDRAVRRAQELLAPAEEGV